MASFPFRLCGFLISRHKKDTTRMFIQCLSIYTLHFVAFMFLVLL